ncbi:MAG: Xaa-Pro peptidase family protein [Pseudomonadota bacterium]
MHFSEAEFAERRAKTCAAMAERGIDALLMFRQESMYYLTGYDTFGYVFFQTLILTADGRTTLLTRAPDLRQAKFTSVIDDVHVWKDGADAQPVNDLKALLGELGLTGKRLGVEYNAYGLTAADGRTFDAGLDGVADLEDASDIVSRLRLIKSAAEIDYVREAATLGDAAWNAALQTAEPGAFEGDILAAMHAEIFRRGGDDPANEFILGSGPGALMCRYYSGRRHLEAEDNLTLEFAGTYRHYHSCLFRTIHIGNASAHQQSLYAASRDALQACEEALAPGNTVADVFDAHARTLDQAGLERYRLNACGYSLGTTFAPNWMDWPMVYAGNAVVLEPGMVFFLHMVIFDDDTGTPACIGRTSLIAPSGAEPLSEANLDLPVL